MKIGWQYGGVIMHIMAAAKKISGEIIMAKESGINTGSINNGNQQRNQNGGVWRSESVMNGNLKMAAKWRK
jgi:hypothetical protein